MASRRDEDDRSDSARIARRAVERLSEGRSESVGDAVDDAARELRARAGFRRPTRAELRAHAQAHEESLGPGVRERRIVDTLEEALEVLAVLEAHVIAHDPEGAERPAPEVYGRAALGELDLDPTVHIRVVTSLSIGDLAAAAVEAGLAEPAFETVDSRHGRIDRLAAEGAFARYRVSRIPPGMRLDPGRDLVSGERVAHAGFEAISRRIGGLGHLDP
ncbi:MAG: hypothetical protein LW806_04920 [Planctomycetaceae bacterium]|jgi:hypothetical protein|nr:hypothetical protein [Planctomycetaceae bacterium]